MTFSRRRPQAMVTADLARSALGSRRTVTRTPVDPSAGVPPCAARRPGYDAVMRSMRSVVRPAAFLVVALALGACTGSPVVTPAASPAVSAARTPAASTAVRTPRPSAPSPTQAESAAASGSAAPSEPDATPVGITQTPWGRILDAVPAEFPVFPAATVADAPPDGAVSGAWVSTAPATEVANWYRDALRAANFAKVDLGSALEDGSRVLDVQGDLPECKAQVTVKPRGASTLITVLFGAGCAGGSG
jgi:hypothetical protein